MSGDDEVRAVQRDGREVERERRGYDTNGRELLAERTALRENGPVRILALPAALPWR